MKKALMCTLLALLFVSGCNTNAGPAAIGITLSSGATQALDQGQSVIITATVANDAAGKGVTWSLVSGPGAIASQTTTGVTYNANGAAGTAVITAISVTDITKIFTLTITVTAPPAITTTTVPAGVEGTVYSQAIAKTGGAGTLTFSISAGALPAGLTLSGAGTISGTPTGPNGTANFTVKVTDSSTMTPMTATQVLSILINLPAAPAITTMTLPPGVEGTAYSQMVAATGFGALTFTTSAGTLPPGLTLSPAGLISGTPTTPNVTSSFTVMVTDSSNPPQTATQALSILINLPPPPTITSLSQNAGAVGASITITGTNFGTPQGSSTVTFNGTVAAAASAWTTTSITVTVPAGATTGNVVVTVLGQASNGSPFTLVLPPSITSLSQISGAVGVSITITGTNFGTPQGSSTVTFNGTAAAPASAWSTTSITVTVPVGATTGNVVVTVLGSASNGSPFTVAPTITSLSQTSGAVGASITITGTNFGTPQGASSVTFNGTAAAAASAWSITSITVAVPAGATTGNVVVTVGAQVSNGSTFTIVLPPSITNLSLTSGPAGTSITITGTNFGGTQGTSTVTFNGVAAAAASAWSATSITVSVPAGATTGNVVVTVFGTASNGSTFTVTASCTTNCSLSGTVTGPWVSNVTISLTGTASVSTTTAANGTYSFANLAVGTYTITPSLAGYNYTPAPPTIAISSNSVQNFVAASTMASFSISGTVSGSSTSGIVYIRVSNCGGGANCNTRAGTTLASVSTNSGSYTVRGLSPGNGYTVSAEIDTLNTGAQNESNPRGSTPSPITITNADVPGANIIIAPQTIDAPVTPNKPSVFPASGAAFISYKQPRNSTTGEEIATTYRIYHGTDTAASNLGFVTVPAGDSNNVYVLSGLTNGTAYYFKMSALNVNGESTVPPASVVGPITINASTGANTVSGSVTFTGITPPVGSALYVGMFSNTSGVYFERIANPSISQAYSVAGILTGTYQAFAVLDVAGTGFVGVGDVTNFGSNGPPSLVVNTSISANNITLAAVSAKTFVATNHQRSGSTDSYGLTLSQDVGTKRPVSMTLFSGNNVAIPFDMTAERNNGYNPIFNFPVRPLSTDVYQFLVTFSDGTTQIMSSTGLTVLDSFAQNLAVNTPVNSTSPTPATVPMFNWSAPASPPAFYNYSSVSLNNANGAQESWEYNGGNNSNGIPSTQLNVMFNVDGSANPSSSLTTGTTYNWRVTVQDDNGNTAQFQTTYIP